MSPAEFVIHTLNKNGPLLRGPRAVQAAKRGAKLYVLNPQQGWIEAGEHAIERAEKIGWPGNSIYGTLSER